MTEENENAVSTTRLNFNSAPAETKEEDFTPPAFLNKGDAAETETVTEVEDMNEAADQVAVEATVDGSQADLVQDVEKELTVHAGEANVAPETVREEAPQAVAEQVAENVEAVQATTEASTEEARPAPTMGATTDGESIEDLRARQDEINRKINERKNSEKQAVLDQIKTVVASYDISVQEVVDALGGLKKTRAGSKAKPKYRDPATGKEWSGRGKEPLWIKGQDRTQFAITE